MTISSSELEQSEQSTFLSVERPASPSQLPGSEEDWAMTVATWPSDSARLLTSLLPPGSFGKMSQGYSAVTEDGTLVPSSGRWSNAAMGSPTAFSMLCISESPNDGPRYKAIGNSMAVPVMRWIGQRIDQIDTLLRGSTPVAGGCNDTLKGVPSSNVRQPPAKVEKMEQGALFC